MTIKPPIASCVRQLSPFLRYVVILIPLQHTKAGISTFQRRIFRLRKFYWHTTFTNPFTNFVPLSKLSSENVAPTDSSKTNRQTFFYLLLIGLGIARKCSANNKASRCKPKEIANIRQTAWKRWQVPMSFHGISETQTVCSANRRWWFFPMV